MENFLFLWLPMVVIGGEIFIFFLRVTEEKE